MEAHLRRILFDTSVQNGDTDPLAIR